MDILQSDGNASKVFQREDYTSDGVLKTLENDLALVVQSAKKGEAYIANKQWSLMWRDADLLYQSPRPMSVYENTYVLEPNVQRFTVAKVCNAIVPQLVKGLFYTDPPMILRPRPNVSQDIVNAKTALFSYLLEACNFKRDTKWGLEQMAHQGTGIWKWGMQYKKVSVKKRKASVTKINTGPDSALTPAAVIIDQVPEITTTERMICTPFFEFRPINRVIPDPQLEVGDIREGTFAIDVRYMNYHQVLELKTSNTKDGKLEGGWHFPSDLMGVWVDNNSEVSAPTNSLDQSAFANGQVFHSESQNIQVSPDQLFKKLEVLEYWDKQRKILVLNRKKVIYSGPNPFEQLPFLSANWWTRARAFYGMGLGLIVGQNQRVDQGTINAILKILSFGVNPIYLRRRDANSPTQMLRSQIGKILTVDGDADKAYELLETPKVPGDIWSALKESESATESSSGADQMLVQGSTSGPRTSMGRTAGGAATLAGASATRLDGPLDNFIDQVFKPFLSILDMLVFNYMSDAEIVQILGDKMGKDFLDNVKLQDFHDAKIEYEVLAGASLSAKRIMAQSLTLITQIFENPSIQQSLAEINEEYVDFKPILEMWMEASEWKNKQDIIKPLTPAMKLKMQQKSEAAQQQSKAAVAGQLQDQKFQQKQQLESQANDGRIQRDIVREAFRNSAMSQAVQGQPSAGGLSGSGETPTVV